MRSAAALLCTLCAHVSSLQLPVVWQKRHPHANQMYGMDQPQFGQHVTRPLHATATALSTVVMAPPACPALESAAAVDSAPPESSFAFVGYAWFIFSVLAGIKGIGDKIQEAANEKEGIGKGGQQPSSATGDDV
jgi:hypothetical protein